MEREGGGSSDDSQPIGHLNQQPRRYPKRKRESPEFFNGKDQDQLTEFKKKVNKMRSKLSMDIRFAATCPSDAYESLCIFTDPRGFRINFGACSTGESYYPENDMSYLTILRTLANFLEIRGTCSWSECYRCISKHIPDVYSVMPMQDVDEIVQDFQFIYVDAYIAADWKRLKDFLLAPDSEGEYSDDPTKFEQKLMDDYGDIPKSEISRVLKVTIAFVRWWTNKSNQAEEAAARGLITYKFEVAQEFSDNRLRREGYTKCDYLKLKLDIAGKIGIVDLEPEIAKFHLPGHYDWSSDDF